MWKYQPPTNHLKWFPPNLLDPLDSGALDRKTLRGVWPYLALIRGPQPPAMAAVIEVFRFLTSGSNLDNPEWAANGSIELAIDMLVSFDGKEHPWSIADAIRCLISLAVDDGKPKWVQTGIAVSDARSLTGIQGIVDSDIRAWSLYRNPATVIAAIDLGFPVLAAIATCSEWANYCGSDEASIGVMVNESSYDDATVVIIDQYDTSSSTFGFRTVDGSFGQDVATGTMPSSLLLAQHACYELVVMSQV